MLSIPSQNYSLLYQFYFSFSFYLQPLTFTFHLQPPTSNIQTLSLTLHANLIHMLSIGLIKEGKVPGDNRIALIPSQCKWLLKNVPGFAIKVEHSDSRCFSDAEFESAGIEITD